MKILKKFLLVFNYRSEKETYLGTFFTEIIEISPSELKINETN
jgi:hypothetical protein